MREKLEEFRALCRELTPRELGCVGSAVTVESITKCAQDLCENDRRAFERCADKWWRRAWEMNNKRTGNNN